MKTIKRILISLTMGLFAAIGLAIVVGVVAIVKGVLDLFFTPLGAMLIVLGAVGLAVAAISFFSERK